MRFLSRQEEENFSVEKLPKYCRHCKLRESVDMSDGDSPDSPYRAFRDGSMSNAFPREWSLTQSRRTISSVR
jgi:hypothetical protein